MTPTMADPAVGALLSRVRKEAHSPPPRASIALARQLGPMRKHRSVPSHRSGDADLKLAITYIRLSCAAAKSGKSGKRKYEKMLVDMEREGRLQPVLSQVLEKLGIEQELAG